jgi:hypothetical protein
MKVNPLIRTPAAAPQVPPNRPELEAGTNIGYTMLFDTSRCSPHGKRYPARIFGERSGDRSGFQYRLGVT